MNDLKDQRSVWDLNHSQLQQCDQIIKKMVFNAQSQDNVGHVYDLIRSLFDVLREVMGNKEACKKNEDYKIQEARESQTKGEMKMVKNIEIVIDVFKKAAEKVGKIGEREWMLTIEQQAAVLEEIVTIHSKQGDQQRTYREPSKSDLDICLGDFNFCLNKVLDQIVSNDSSQRMNTISDHH